MAVYTCKYCGSIVEDDRTPRSSGCNAPGHSSHYWAKVCTDCSIKPQSGLKPYVCKYCHNVVYSSRTPSSSGCSENSSHHWSSVGSEIKYSDLDKLKSINAQDAEQL